ncbi:hypothetical protein [Nocardia thailandica]|uniref:hypothetical protein n=1 Tax=Nocardia thailandica TaxID=257275 RepID=UPI00031FB0DB|nr:hypothetical protein [Nocardia thailandica]
MSLADDVANLASRDPINKGSIDVTSDGATVNNVVVDGPINDDWSTVFALFNLDATEFEVVDDTVRMSTWQQSKGLDNGTRDVVQLYAYSARFRRRRSTDVSPETLAAWQEALRAHPLPRPVQRRDGSTYVILVADPQLGKKGTEEAVANWRRGVEAHLVLAQMLAPELAGVHVAFMGDETEGVCNNYGNQPHTVELNMSRQLELDFDLRVWTIKEAASLGLPLSVSSVISNHGEWTRNGSKEPVTSQGDNASTHIARQVRKLFDELAEHGAAPAIDWHIGAGDPAITLTLSGVDCYFSHGYIEKGRGSSSETRTRNAIERQILGRTEQLGETSLFFTAHYHHFYSQEFEGRTLFGCPALEAERSSEYMLNQYGVWSPAGMLGLMVGAHNQRGWSNLNVF